MGERTNNGKASTGEAFVGTFRIQHLIDAGVLAVGDGYRAKNIELAAHGIPFARAGNIDGGFLFNDADCFPEADLHKVGDKISRPGDVVFTSKGTVGRFAYVLRETPRFVFAPQLCYWRSLNASVIDSRFLLYWMHGEEFWEQADAVKGQTDMADYVSLTDQRRMWITLPPLPEQRAIARVLGGLDDKIELNRRMNRTLEDMARALFNDWLERMEGELETVTTQSLTDSGVLVIGDGYRAKRSELRPTGLPFARAGNIDGGFQFTDCEYMGADGIQAAGDKLSRPLDSVFTSKGTVGRLALVSKSTPTFVYAPQLCFWRAADPSRLNPFVLHQWMHGDEFGEQVDMTKGQTDMADYVSLTDQRRMRITLPSPKRQAEVGRHLERLYGMMDQNTTQIGTLAALRDSLLPVLLSGELRLHHASAAVEEVLA